MTWRLQITVDRDSPIPLREQVRLTIKQMIKTGVLHPGVRIPSTRGLSEDLGVARSVVVEAYQQLQAEGYLTSTHRSGTRVAALATSGLTVDTTPVAGEPVTDTGLAPPIRWDLRTGLADSGAFPRSEWLTCLQEVIYSADTEQLEYPPLSGVAELRAELAAYLGRVRAVRAMPEHVMVTSGFAQGLAMICAMLREAGHDTIATEDPGHPGERRFIHGTGLRCAAVPVDDEGIDVHALERSGARAVLVTPAHQFPTGTVLSPYRRAALVEWARRVGGLIVEDDYDGEFWFEGGGRPLSLQGQAPDCVVYGGSVSKTLAPGLRLGWLAVPASIVAPLERIRMRHDLGISTFCQLTYATFIRSGRLDRHLRGIGKRYRERRNSVVAAFATEFPDAQVKGPAAGLHVYVVLPEGLDEVTVVRDVAQRGVLVRGASMFSVDRPPPSAGLVIGYATQPPDALAAAISALAAAARAERLPTRI